MEFHGIEWDNQTWLAAKNLINRCLQLGKSSIKGWLSSKSCLITGGYLASKISHTLRLNTHVLYIISLNLVQCGHIYTYSDVCPHLSILYSIFSVLPYTMTIYIYSLVWWLWWGWSGSVSHFVLDKVCCLWVHIFIFYYTISYIMYHIQYVFIYIYIWLVVSNIVYFPFHKGDGILPIDELHHFSSWLKPPTRYIWRIQHL